MFRPQFPSHYHPSFGPRPSQFNPRGQFLQRNFGMQRYRSPRPSTVNYNYQFWCETCDKGFPTLHILDSHKLQHQKCNIDGCQFVAHPKIITSHIQMQHSTGLYTKIAKLNNPEEIQKWREERKRNYPTKQNIEKKASEIKEKIERGEKMGLRTHKNRSDKNIKSEFNSSVKQQKFGRERFQGRQYNSKFRKENIHTPPPKRECKMIPFENEICKLIPFAGLHQIIINDNMNDDVTELHQKTLIEDDILTEELTNNLVNNMAKSEPSVCGALSSLINNYGSSDEEATNDNTMNKTKEYSLEFQVERSTETEIKETINEKLVSVSIKNENDKSDDDSGPEEAIISKVTTDNNIEADDSKSNKPKIEKRIRNYNTTLKQNRPKYKLPSTLLVKLLSREIEQERNIILQCVRYVVNNNFFNNTSNKD